ncbi:Arc-like DNA binding domain protein [compost metagenome]
MSFNGDSRLADKFVVRMPDGMRERITEIAAANHRSMNSEIILALKTLVDDATPIKGAMPLATSAEEIRALEAFRKLPKEKRLAMLTLLSSDQ